MLVTVIYSASSLASEKGQFCQFFVQLDSAQECSGQLFGALFWRRTDTRAFCQAVSSRQRSPLSVLAYQVIGQKIIDLSLEF
jgi:hypothetical protein